MSPLDSIDALKEFPFKVTYPKAGDLFLLRWYDDYVRGHVIATAREDRIEPMLREVYLREGPQVRLTDYWRATIVSLPKEIRQVYGRGRLDEDVTDFRYFVGYLFQQAQDKDHPVKKEATRCKSYRTLWDGETDPGTDKDHSQCQNCFFGWLPKGETVESLYMRRRHEPRHKNNFPPYRPKPGQRTGYPEKAESVAPEADLSKPLYALAQHFGDHSDGLKISTVEKYEGKWPFGAHHGITPISFFFQGEKLEIPKRFVALGKTAKADAEKAEKQKKKDFDAGKKKERFDANERLRRLLEP